MLEVKNLSFRYGSRQVLNDISFSAEGGEFLSVLGSNGVGKSTLFKCILGLLPMETGCVMIDGEDASGMSPRELASRIAYIPQTSASAFNYSVEDIVLMGTTPGLGMLRNPGREEMARVDSALERMNITQRRGRCFHHLSGGEKQLVIFARALAQNAGILLLDEPASALDFGNQMMIQNVARSLAREGYTVIQTTHDPEKAYMFSDRLIALRSGEILAQGRPNEVLTAENIHALYGVQAEMASIYGDRVRIFTPISVLE